MASAETEVSSNSAGGPAVLFKKKRRIAQQQPSTSTASTSSSGASAAQRDVGEGSSSSSSLLRRSRSDDDAHEQESAASVVRPRNKQRSLNARSALSASTGLARRVRDQQDLDDDDDDDDGGDAGDAGWVDRFGETLHETGTTGSVVGGKRKRGVDGLLEGLDEDAQRIDAIHGAAADSDEQTLGGDGTYKGMKAYSSYLPTRDSGQSSKLSAAAAKGPIQGSKHIRTITLVDYQPDICKSYKETGYCGFGDTCKFLHDRSDYLAGWQLDSLPNSNARRGSDDEEEEEDEEEEVPFACLICRKPFTDPVVTRCGHYFCSACAIKRFSKTSKCFACGAQTGGLFNSATKILAKMERKRRGKEEEKSKKRNKWLPAGEKAEEDNEENGQDSLGIEGVEVEDAGEDVE